MLNNVDVRWKEAKRHMEKRWRKCGNKEEIWWKYGGKSGNKVKIRWI